MISMLCSLPRSARFTKKTKKEDEMKKTVIREKAKDAIQEALSIAYYRVSDDPEKYGATEDEAVEIIAEMDRICEQLCKRIGRTHYTV